MLELLTISVVVGTPSGLGWGKEQGRVRAVVRVSECALEHLPRPLASAVVVPRQRPRGAALCVYRVLEPTFWSVECQPQAHADA